MTRRSATNFRK